MDHTTLLINWGSILTSGIVGFVSAGLGWLGSYMVFKQRVLDKFDSLDDEIKRLGDQRKLDQVAVKEELLKMNEDARIKFKQVHERIDKKDEDLKVMLREITRENSADHGKIVGTLAEISKQVSYMAGKLDTHIENGNGKK